MSSKESNIEQLQLALGRLDKNENIVYFLVYDTKTNPRASIKYIYDMALELKENEFNVKIIVEDKTYGGVSSWLDEKYNQIDVVTIKEDKVEIKVDDIIVVPEHYSNIIPQLSNIKCVKIMLVQQKEYMFETLSIGSRWSDFGFEKCITTTEASKKYILEYFPEALVYVIPPFIEDYFVPSTEPIKPYVAISSRDRLQHRKLISEFYLKYPQFRWITFRDMVQMTNIEFSEALKECMVSVWIDDESTFGTFPLESMKCKVPVIGKVPFTEPDWMGENGMWTYDGNKVVELLGIFVTSWLNGENIPDDISEKMELSVAPYTKTVHTNNTLSIFTTLVSTRKDAIKNTIDKLKTELE